MTALLLRYWPHLVAVLAVVAVLGGTYVKGRSAGQEAAQAQCSERFDAARAAAEQRLEEAQAAYEAERAERVRLAARLRNLPPPPEPRTLVREVPVNATVTTCPRLSPDFRMHFNAPPVADAGATPTGLVSERSNP